MTTPIPEELPVCRGPLAFPQVQPEKDLADLPPCSPCADQSSDIFDFSGPWLCPPKEEAVAKLPVLPDLVPDILPDDPGEELIPDWPEAKRNGLGAGILFASLLFHVALVLLGLGLMHLNPPEVDFELAAGSTFLDFDMVQIAKLGGGQELAPGETASPEQVAEEETPPEPATELEPLARAEPAPVPEIAPIPELDLKTADTPEEKPKAEAPKPKKAAKEQAKPKPPKAIGNPEPGGKAGAGPGNVLGSVNGNAAVGGGGAGGKANRGQVGWLVARRPEPRYPEAAKRAGEQGKVVITVTVTSGGKVGGASVAQSSGHSRLDQAALSAAKGIVFKPNKGGAPSGMVTVRVPYQFDLKRR